MNQKDRKKYEFFKHQFIGNNSFQKIIPNIFDTVGVIGTGLSKFVKTHCLSGTIVNLILEAGHFDTTIVLWLGNSQVQSILSYTNLQVNEGLQQHLDIFGEATYDRVNNQSNEVKRTRKKKVEETDANAVKRVKI